MTLVLIFSLCLPPFLGAPTDPLALFRRWRNSPSPELRVQAARSLRGLDGPDARTALLSLLADAEAAVRKAAREELILRPPSDGPELAAEVSRLRSPRARVEGLRAILARKGDASRFALDAASEVRARALFSRRVAAGPLAVALRHREGLTRALALEALGDPALAEGRVRDRAEEVRIAAARTAADPAPVAALLKDRSWRVRLAAVRAATRLRRKELIPPLIDALEGEPGLIPARAADALEGLTGAGFGLHAERWRRWWRTARQGLQLRAPPRRRAAGGSVATLTFRRIPVVSRRICFVLDASKSMAKPAPGKKGKTRWDLVREDLLLVLDRLPQGARFNVVFFRTDIEVWKPRVVRATPATKRACRRWVEEAKPAGWTNLFDALARAIEDDEVDTIYVLTDGVPSRGAETSRRAILQELAFLNHYRLIEIHCVQAGGTEGLGRRWRGFLDELAQQHGGLSVRE